MIIRIVEGTQGIQGTVSGTDQTVAALTNADDHTAPNVLRVWVENQSGDDYVKKSGDTMSGELVAPTGTFAESLTVSGVPVVTGTLFAKDISIEVPDEDEDIGFFYSKRDLTVDSVQAVVVGSGVGFSSSWTIRHDPERWETGTELVTGGTTTTNSGVGDTITSFDSSFIPSQSWVWVETTAYVPNLNLLTISLEGRNS